MRRRSRGVQAECAGQGSEMKSQRRQVRGVGDKRMSGNEQVRREIQSFLQALHSYPERFSQDPGITFEEHRSSLIALVPTEPRRHD